jgi:hypothetical protein
MSRELDYSNLSEDDVAYMVQRPWLVAEAEAEGFEVAAQLPEAPDAPDTDVVQLSLRDGQELPTQADPAVSPSAEEPPLDTEDGDAYTEWKVAELREEIESRNAERDEEDHLSTSGTKAELVARLEADDERSSE